MSVACRSSHCPCVHNVKSMKKKFLQFGVEEFDWLAQSFDLILINTFGMTWNAGQAQHERLTSLMLWWLNGSKSRQRSFKIWRKFSE